LTDRKSFEKLKQVAEIISKKILASGHFLSLERLSWRDSQGQEGIWEVARRNNGIAAVLIIAWLQPSDRLILVRQYRPPAEGEVIEFPAGILDKGESVDQGALRELLEETGYHGQIRRVTPAAFNTPGLSSDRTHLAIVEVDEKDTRNQCPTPRPEAGEEIRVIQIARADLMQFFTSETSRGAFFDSKVAAYLTALT
jgi:8-oxo-dGTP pyrophosphatase MutT (NUDIX family)